MSENLAPQQISFKNIPLLDKGYPLVVNKNLTFFKDYFLYKFGNCSWVNISSLYCVETKNTINFISERKSKLIIYKDNEAVCKLGYSGYFVSKKRKDAFAAAYLIFQIKTRRTRLIRHFNHIRENGFLEINGIKIFKNGDIQKKSRILNLHNILMEGKIETGISIGEGNFYFNYSDPYRVKFIHNKKSINLWLYYDKDIFFDLLELLVKNKNNLL